MNNRMKTMKTLLNQNERLTQILLEEIRLVIITRATGVISEDEMFEFINPLLEMASSLTSSIKEKLKEK